MLVVTNSFIKSPKTRRMAKIINGFWLKLLDIKIVPGSFDGGQAGRTVARAKRGNERADPENASVTLP